MKKLNFNIPMVLISILFIFLTQFPYIYAALQSNEQMIFGGFLFNPLDGNTYLSKMRQGWEGRWFFELTYSPEKNQPAFLFTFYLLLGHLSRIIHLDLLISYHLARLLACLALFFTIRNFFLWVFEDNRIVDIALLWAMYGAGVGWLAIPFGGLPADFWIAEGYVFLSSFANPHFPLAMAIMLWMLTLSRRALEHQLNIVTAFLAGLSLANLSPFSYIICGAIMVIFFLLSFQKSDETSKKAVFMRLLGFGLGGFPFIFYQYWIVRSDAVLAEWNRQNVTPSPNLGEFILGYFPLAIWAFFGAVQALKQKETRFLLPLVWMAVSLLLAYIPSSLQRRFMIGLYIPMVALAMLAFQGMSLSYDRHSKRNSPFFWLGLSIAISMVTNFVILFATFRAVQQQDSAIFLYREEFGAYHWLGDHLPDNAVVLASPSSGALIPARTGLRVIYGHPFESIHATERKRLVEKFYQGQMSHSEQIQFLSDYSVDAILWGIREREISSARLPNYLEQTFPICYRSENITIFRVVP